MESLEVVWYVVDEVRRIVACIANASSHLEHDVYCGANRAGFRNTLSRRPSIFDLFEEDDEGSRYVLPWFLL